MKRTRHNLLAALLLVPALARAAGPSGPLDHANNRFYAPMTSRAAALFQDTDGDLDIDDPDDRDFIRTTVDDRVVQFANHFAATLDVAQLKSSIAKLVDPAMASAIPAAFWNSLTGLPQLPTDSSGWSPENAADLRKIRSAFMLVSMLEFGAPGKFALLDDAGGTRGGVDTFAAEQGTDPELLKKVKEYEDAWQRLLIVRILGFTPSAQDPAVVGRTTARALATGQNAPSDAVLDQWWAGVTAGPLKPASDIWKLNQAWWDLNPGSDKARTKAGELDAAAGGKTPILSGAQLVSTEARGIAPGSPDPAALLEKLSTADNWKIKANYQSYPDGVPVTGGTWTINGLNLSYAVPGNPPVSPTRTSNVICASLEMVNEPLDLYFFDKSYQVAYGESYSSEDAVPNFPARSIAQYLDRLLDAREKPPVSLPATIGDFAGGTRGRSTVSGSFSASAGIGTSF